MSQGPPPGGDIPITLEVYFRFRGQPFYRGEERVPAGTTLPALTERIGLGGERGLAILVNGRYHPDDKPLSPGDLVTLVHRSEGGGDRRGLALFFAALYGVVEPLRGYSAPDWSHRLEPRQEPAGEVVLT